MLKKRLRKLKDLLKRNNLKRGLKKGILFSLTVTYFVLWNKQPVNAIGNQDVFGRIKKNWTWQDFWSSPEYLLVSKKGTILTISNLGVLAGASVSAAVIGVCVYSYNKYRENLLLRVSLDLMALKINNLESHIAAL
jgi:hypothetical protein